MRLDRIFLNGMYPDLFRDEEAETVRERYEQTVGDGRPAANRWRRQRLPNPIGGDEPPSGIDVVRRAALRAAISEHTPARAHREQLRASRRDPASGRCRCRSCSSLRWTCRPSRSWRTRSRTRFERRRPYWRASGSASAPARAASARRPPRRPWQWERRRPEEGRRRGSSTRRSDSRTRSACGSWATRNAAWSTERFEAHGIEMKGEGLWAMMLDAKRTFDDLIERHAPDRRDARLESSEPPSTRRVSNAMAGSQETMAMGKLYRAAPGGPLRTSSCSTLRRALADLLGRARSSG